MIPSGHHDLNRRDLFAPEQLAVATGQVAAALDLGSDPAGVVPDELALVRLGWQAMATRWEIVLPWGTAQALEAGQDAFALLDRLEAQLTVYRPDSEVSRLNRTATRRPVRLESRLFRLLEQSYHLSAETEGAFDITTGPLIRLWGFFQGPRRVPTEPERRTTLEAVGFRHLLLDAPGQSVAFRHPQVGINLGSIGKGYALDRLAGCLSQHWKIHTVLLHGGSSSVYAKGSPRSDGRGWCVRLRHPWIPGRYLGQVNLLDRALGTSAATFQYLEFQGKKLGHVLDPRSGWPAAGVASASVVAPEGAQADALSTAFYVGGIDLARSYCDRHPEIGAVLLLEGERDPVVLNLPPADFSLS
ncbi:MAG: FAD:protein FMN transferase [Gemmataceae bacterium]